MPHLYPPSPRFPPDDGGAEHAVWRALADQLPDDVALFHGLRIQEAAHEHEIDLLIAWPGVGLAAIEVKGGHITRDAGAWHQGCLLYTSPSPRDRTRSRMPSSA